MHYFSGEEDIQEIIATVVQIRTRYKAFGMMLGLSCTELEAIEMSITPFNVGEALRRVILTWLRQEYDVKKFGHPTWRRIVEAMDHEAGGNNHALAKAVATDHPVRLLSGELSCVLLINNVCSTMHG